MIEQLQNASRLYTYITRSAIHVTRIEPGNAAAMATTTRAGMTRPVGPSKDWAAAATQMLWTGVIDFVLHPELFKRQIWTKHRKFDYDHLLPTCFCPLAASHGCTDGKRLDGRDR